MSADTKNESSHEDDRSLPIHDIPPLQKFHSTDGQPMPTDASWPASLVVVLMEPDSKERYIIHRHLQSLSGTGIVATMERRSAQTLLSTMASTLGACPRGDKQGKLLAFINIHPGSVDSELLAFYEKELLDSNKGKNPRLFHSPLTPDNLSLVIRCMSKGNFQEFLHALMFTGLTVEQKVSWRTKATAEESPDPSAPQNTGIEASESSPAEETEADSILSSSSSAAAVQSTPVVETEQPWVQQRGTKSKRRNNKRGAKNGKGTR